MSSSGAIRAAKGYVEVGIDDSALDRGLGAARAKLASFGASVAGWGARLVGLGLSMASPFVYAINAASNAAETLNKFEAVFGDQAAAADRFAQSLGASIGRGTTEVRNGMSALMAQFVGLGFGREEARKMAEEMTALSYDFGSFFNISDEEAMSRFISAMSGSSEVLDQFGVNAKAAALDQEFLRMGLNVTTANATEQQKALARFNIIKNTMKGQGAVGDAVKTADSFANTLKRVKAQVVDAAEAIGTALLLPMADVLGILARGIAAFAAWARANQMAVVGVAAGIASILGAGTALVALGGAAYVASMAIGLLAPVISFAAGGFGLLTVASWLWGGAAVAASVMAGLAISAWGIAVGTASAIATAWTWTYNAALAAVGLLTWGYNVAVGVLSGTLIAAKVATLLYSVAMAVAAIKTALATGGVNLLVGALVTLAFIALPAVAAALLAPFAAIAYLMYTTGAFSGIVQSARNAANGISSAWARTVSGFTDMMGTLVGTGITAFGAIQDAFSMGDWSLIWETVKVSGMIAWNELSFFAVATWNTWKDTLIDTFVSVWVELRALFSVGWGFLKAGWFALTGVILTAMQGPFNLIKDLLYGMSIIDPTGVATRAYDALNAVNVDDAVRQADRNVVNAIQGGQDEANAIRQQARNDQLQRLLERAERDGRLRLEHDVEAARLQGELDEIADLARFNADWAFATDGDREIAMARRELRNLARDAGNQIEADEHQAAIDQLWEDAAVGALFDMDRLREAGDVSREKDTAKGQVLGSFNAQAIFGMLGSMAAESPAVRAARLQQESNQLLAEVRDGIRRVEEVAGARRS